MAVDTVAFSSYVSGNTGTSATHTQEAVVPSGGNGFILIAVHTNDTNAGSPFTSVTYDGAAFTKLYEWQQNFNSRWNSVWYIRGVAAKTANIVVTIDTADYYIFISAAVYSGVDSSSAPDAQSHFSGSSATSTTTDVLTVNEANAWHVAAYYTHYGRTYAAGSGTTNRGQNASASEGIADSNGTVSGTHTLNHALTSSTTEWSTVDVMLNPGTVVVVSDIEAMNGIALADIEAVNGITAANGEAINGITF